MTRRKDTLAVGGLISRSKSVVALAHILARSTSQCGYYASRTVQQQWSRNKHLPSELKPPLVAVRCVVEKTANLQHYGQFKHGFLQVMVLENFVFRHDGIRQRTIPRTLQRSIILSDIRRVPLSKWAGFNGTSTQFRSLVPSLTRKAGTESTTVKESRRYINLGNAI